MVAPGTSTQPQAKAPCYRCDAGIGECCRGATGLPRTKPHPERGAYGAWTLKPRDESEHADRRLRGKRLPPLPKARRVLTAQPELVVLARRRAA